MSESSESILSQENGIYVANGNMQVNGNLEVSDQLTVGNFKILGDNHLPVFSSSGVFFSFRKACEFTKAVQFNNGQTLIGYETTYGSAYVGSPTIQAGDRLVVGDSTFKVTDNDRTIIADTYKMSLARLVADVVTSKKETTDLLETTDAKVTRELVAQDVYADTIKTNKLYLENISGLNLQAASQMSTKDLIVGGSAKIQNGVTIMGKGSANGAALTVNGGEIVANKGIVSHTGNNKFQTMQIMGSGTDHDVCFRIDKNVDSLIEGDVTIQDSKLILENSKFVADTIIVTPLSEINEETQSSGVRITTSGGWETYKEGMLAVQEPDEAYGDNEYDPVDSVAQARERNHQNYSRTHGTLKDIINPITYLLERQDDNIPKRFSVKNGVYRIDSSGNALFRNVVSETGKFSSIEAFKFKVNQIQTDKMVLTSVASNVVDTDNLLKSRGIAEFDGVINSNADVFIEEGSQVNVASGAKMTFEEGAELKLKDGSKFEMGTDTTVRMSGDIELDLSKLVFVDSTTGRKFKISFRDAHECEGIGIVMDYSEVEQQEAETTPRKSPVNTELDARELDKKLKSLGI